MKMNRKLFKYLDYSILFSVIAIAILGTISIGFATNAISFQPPYINLSASRTFITQIIWFIIASAAGFYILIIDYNVIGGYYKILYVGINILLLLVLLVGSERNGAKAWLGVGSLGIQPSEFAKIITIITLAKIMEDMENINTPKNLGKIALYALIPIGLIQLQPDTGTNLIFAMTILGMLFVAGLDLKFIYGGLIAAISGVLVLWNFDILEPYQKNRILVFFKPELDRLGSGYNAMLAKMAVGSGKFFSLFSSSDALSGGKFIPEAHTDFIFTVFAERWGFLGSVILLALYFNIIFKGIKIARTSKDKFGTYVVFGVLSMFTFQILQNIGMDIGLMPITGIPLPFMSYGGSSLLTSVVSISLILNVGMRRQKINF
ncbi:rod shape-determining protein RodA [Fonticella tunisiensis]|uniref:Rod shape determining protein RodA n=1 Tax=Fonticella tunisiensis TaxID=1096341 RepID=A0A4R7KRG4_9CLOT|nr:rod shape-determining protein RodA [Fonticella tunisiensis]TDT61203.1 rod shape determining protein RodA [Fonticella tunisiensis]